MHDQNLAEYIQSALARGVTKEDIYKELLASGWSIEVIQENFKASTAKEEKEQSSKQVIKVILGIGALLIGAGIFSLVASNWDAFTDSTKVGVILFFMLGSYALGWYLREYAHSPKTGEAFFFLGSIIFGAGIFLIAQIFNVKIDWPDGFFYWMIGVLAMAFAANSYPLFFLALPLSVATLIGYPILLFSEKAQTPSLLLLISTVVMFASAVAIRKRVSPEINNIY